MVHSIKLIAFCFLSLLVLASCDTNKTVQQQIVERHLFKMGVPEKEVDQSFKTTFNNAGKMLLDSNSSSKTVYEYLYDTLLTSETQYGIGDGKVWLKKTIKYDENLRKLSLRFYLSYVNSEPELNGGIDYSYLNSFPIRAKIFGAVEAGDIENYDNLNRHYINEKGLQIVERNQIDTIIVHFIYDENNQLKVLAFNNDSISNINHRYTYDSKGKLRTKELYKGYMGLMKVVKTKDTVNSLSKTTIEYKFNGFGTRKTISSTTIRKYNSDRKVTETIRLDSLNQQEYRFKYIYDQSKRLIEITKYNRIDEPEFIDKFSYTFF